MSACLFAAMNLVRGGLGAPASPGVQPRFVAPLCQLRLASPTTCMQQCTFVPILVLVPVPPSPSPSSVFARWPHPSSPPAPWLSSRWKSPTPAVTAQPPQRRELTIDTRGEDRVSSVGAGASKCPNGARAGRICLREAKKRRLPLHHRLRAALPNPCGRARPPAAAAPDGAARARLPR